MKTWLVGGAVRDRLMGLPVQDRDWVVVGASPQDLLRLGYVPVGNDFPVFLHPQTHEEVALARTERKTAPGYHGFTFHADPEVTLEEDLLRRDLTINAMAQDEAGHLVDPYGGQRDLENKVLRHVSAAFAEDPVRILRLARFAARWPEFAVAPETMALMKQMVIAGEVRALISERVWQEISRGLMATRPSRMLEVLRECGALAHLLPEVERLWRQPLPSLQPTTLSQGEHVLRVLNLAAQLSAPLSVRFACLVYSSAAGTDHSLVTASAATSVVRVLCKRLRVPSDCRELAELIFHQHKNIDACGMHDAHSLWALLERCDALRRPERFAELLTACELIHHSYPGYEQIPYLPLDALTQALRAAQSISTPLITAQAKSAGLLGIEVGKVIQAARIEAIEAYLHHTLGACRTSSVESEN